MIDPRKVSGKGQWWEDNADDESDLGDREKIELQVAFEGDAFYVDGLRDGHYLVIPAHLIFRALTQEFYRDFDRDEDAAQSAGDHV